MVTDFGRILEGYLHARRSSASAFAEQVGMSESFISRVINGERTPPLASLDQWVLALDLTSAAAEEFRMTARLEHAPAELREWFRRQDETVKFQAEMINQLRGELDTIKRLVQDRLDVGVQPSKR